jgi:hypothetical protein
LWNRFHPERRIISPSVNRKLICTLMPMPGIFLACGFFGFETWLAAVAYPCAREFQKSKQAKSSG